MDVSDIDVQALRDIAQRVELGYRYGRDPVVFQLLDNMYRVLPQARPMQTCVRSYNDRALHLGSEDRSVL